MKRLSVATVLIVSLGAGACTTSGPGSTGDNAACLRPSDIVDWGGVDALLFHVKTRNGDVFEGRLKDVCPSVDWTQQIQIRPEMGTRICPGQSARLVIPDPIGRTEFCVADDFRRLSVEEADALPDRSRSKN